MNYCDICFIPPENVCFSLLNKSEKGFLINTYITVKNHKGYYYSHICVTVLLCSLLKASNRRVVKDNHFKESASKKKKEIDCSSLTEFP